MSADSFDTFSRIVIRAFSPARHQQQSCQQQSQTD
jgi:hypothetical protein